MEEKQVTTSAEENKGNEGVSNEAQNVSQEANTTENKTVEKTNEEFTDNEKTKDNPTLKDKPNEELARRSEFAKQRREKEAQEKELKDKEHKAELRGISKALKNLNPFTNEKMETDEDIEFYLEQEEMQKQGLEPNSTVDYKKFKRQQTDKVSTKQPSQEEWVTNDSKDFTSKYPDVVFNDLFADKDFLSYSDKYHKDELGKSTPLSKIYSNYLTYKKEIDELNKSVDKKAQDLFEKRMAKKEASAGSVTKSSNENVEGLIPFEKLKTMTQKEMDKLPLDLINRSYKAGLKQIKN